MFGVTQQFAETPRDSLSIRAVVFDLFDTLVDLTMRDLPRVEIRIESVREDRYRVSVQDNGPGVVKNQLPRIFGRLLYGSKFHSLKQSRGQQGIGISAAGMYGYLTTGKPIEIITRISPRRPAQHVHLIIDNYAIHSSTATRRVLDCLKGKVVLHFLPPYCPDHNRIERSWRDLHANVSGSAPASPFTFRR